MTLHVIMYDPEIAEFHSAETRLVVGTSNTDLKCENWQFSLGHESFISVICYNAVYNK